MPSQGHATDSGGDTGAGARTGTGGPGTGTSTGRSTLPAGVRRALLAGVGLLLASALYLVAVRGEAILAGLTTLAQLCF